MADFIQSGAITTLHKLRERPLQEIEAELIRFGRRQPMALVLPSLFSELEGPALAGIVETLEQVPYLSEIVVGLDQADLDQFRRARLLRCPAATDRHSLARRPPPQRARRHAAGPASGATATGQGT